jgi:hypothetical protein
MIRDLQNVHRTCLHPEGDLAKGGVHDFMRYHSRNYAAKRLQNRGVPLHAIMQVGEQVFSVLRAMTGQSWWTR